MVDLYLAQRVESVGWSIAHVMTIPPGEARVEGRKHCASVLVRGVISGKVRVGQGARIVGGSKFRGLAVTMPDTTTDPMTMFEVFNPTGARLELVLRNPKGLGDIPGLVANQRVGERDVLGDGSHRQPIDELALDLWELGRSKSRVGQRQAIVEPK